MVCTDGYCKIKWINSFRKHFIMYQGGTEGAQVLESRIQIDFHHQFPTCRDFERHIEYLRVTHL
jgi:hypothetical protein